MTVPRKKLRLRKEVRTFLDWIEGIVIIIGIFALAAYMFLRFWRFF